MRLIRLQEHGRSLLHLDDVQHETTQHPDIIRELSIELLDERDQRPFEVALACRIVGFVSLDQCAQGCSVLLLGRVHENLEHALERFLFLVCRLERIVPLARTSLLCEFFKLLDRRVVVLGIWIRVWQGGFGSQREGFQSVGADEGAHFRYGADEKEECRMREEATEAAEVCERNGHLGL